MRRHLLKGIAHWCVDRRLPALLLLGLATPAQAQLAGSIAFASDDMFRGYSVSGGDPAITLGVSAEFGHGFYGGVTAATAFGGSPSPVLNGSNQYLGYARRTASGASVDIGIVHRYYTQYASNDYADDFVEAYIGASFGTVAMRVYASPNYGGAGAPAAYAEINATPFSRGRWSVAAHVGGLLPPSTPGPDHGSLLLIDWQLGVTRTIGPVAAALTWVGQGRTIDDPQVMQKLVFTLGMAF